MAARKKQQTLDEILLANISAEIYLSSNDSSLPALQAAVINSGLSDQEIADKCELCSQTVARVRSCELAESGAEYGPKLRTADEIRRALGKGLVMGDEIRTPKKGKKSNLKLVKKK